MILIDFGGARFFLTSKSSSSRFFALDGQPFRSVRRLELIFGFFTVCTSTCGEIWAPKVGKGGKSGNFLGVGRNPQEMAIEAEGREDVDISSTRHWPEASADQVTNKRSRFFFDFFFYFFRSFRGNSSKKIVFAHRSGALARSGSRELRAVKIPASYDAWRPPKRRKNDSGKIKFFWVSEISFSLFFLDVKGNRQS